MTRRAISPVTISRTRFQFDSGRPGFSVSQNNGVLYLLSGTGNYGGVRCVKDINE